MVEMLDPSGSAESPPKPVCDTCVDKKVVTTPEGTYPCITCTPGHLCPYCGAKFVRGMKTCGVCMHFVTPTEGGY